MGKFVKTRKLALLATTTLSVGSCETQEVTKVVLGTQLVV